MSTYKEFYQKDADLFLRLYKKYLSFKYTIVEDMLKELPTDVIERIFDGAKFREKEDDLFIGFGFSDIEKCVTELEYCYQLMFKDELTDFMDRLGHKVNMKKIGVRKG